MLAEREVCDDEWCRTFVEPCYNPPSYCGAGGECDEEWGECFCPEESQVECSDSACELLCQADEGMGGNWDAVDERCVCALGADGDADADTDSDASGDADGGPDGCGDCPLPNATRCAATTIETCMRSTGGCLHWVAAEDCARRGLGCAEESGEARCTVCFRGTLEGDHRVSDAASLETISGYTSITGDLQIADTPFSTLARLACLRDIGGDLEIVNNERLTNLDGLDGLTSVGGSVTLGNFWGGGYNVALTNVDGLDGLTTIGGHLVVFGNSALENLAGLRALRSVRYDLFIAGNPVLTDLDGLSSVTSVGGSVLIGVYSELEDDLSFRLYRSGNASLSSLAGLAGVESLGGGLYIADSVSLTDLDGLNNVSSLAGELIIWGNAALVDLGSLAGLSRADGGIGIWANAALTNVDGLDGLTTVGAISVWSNPALMNLDGLHGITSVPFGPIEIVDNTALPTCEATGLLDQLIAFDGVVCIQGNLADTCADDPSGCP